MNTKIKFVITTPEFFAADPKKLVVEENHGTGRTYFLDRKGRILAVGQPV